MNKTMKQYEALNWASSFLKEHHREEQIAMLLLQHHLRLDRTAFYQRMQTIVPAEVLAAYVEDIEAHAKTGIPVQHIMGSAPFYGHDFLVNEHVLIPRFETEELVACAAKYLEAQTDRQNMTVADVGTGSGVIAITLKKLFPELTVYATDISEQALQVARQNARRLKTDIRFRKGDFLTPLLEEGVEPTLILSNPPYIAESEKESLTDTVKNFDPHQALFASEEGLFAYRMIATQISGFSQSKLRALFFEIGATQAMAVCEILQEMHPAGTLEVIQDLNGRDRIILKKG